MGVGGWGVGVDKKRPERAAASNVAGSILCVNFRMNFLLNFLMNVYLLLRHMQHFLIKTQFVLAFLTGVLVTTAQLSNNLSLVYLLNVKAS